MIAIPTVGVHNVDKLEVWRHIYVCLPIYPKTRCLTKQTRLRFFRTAVVSKYRLCLTAFVSIEQTICSGDAITLQRSSLIRVGVVPSRLHVR